MIPTDRYCHSGPGNSDNSILTKLSVMPFCRGAAVLHSLFTFIIECSVFPIQCLDVCSKMRLIRKTTCETLRGANATSAMHAFSVTRASA